MKFIDPATDAWRPYDADMPHANTVVNRAQWTERRADWPADLPVALLLANTDDVEDIAEDVNRFALIVLEFPKWTDGRAYSQAHLLRARYRFAGELRATGAVLADMLPLLERCGFDAVQLRDDQVVSVALRALHAVPEHYQADVRHGVDARPLFARTPRPGNAAVGPDPL